MDRCVSIRRRWLVPLVLLAGCIDAAPSQKQQWVINGTPSGPGDYPATGALMAPFGESYFFSCTGTVIHPRVVLTAAHCLHPAFVDSAPGFTLELDATTVANGDIIAGSAGIMHPSFELELPPEPGVQVWYDIGLLFLNEPITSVTPELIATPEETAGLAVGMPVELVGYGITDQVQGNYGIKTQGVGDLVVIGSHEVQVSMPGQQQNCNGDSGGPGYMDFGGGRRLVGVVSRAPGEDPSCDYGGIDTRADAYLEWINATIAEQLALADAGVPDAAPAPDDASSPDGGLDAGEKRDKDDGCGCRSSDKGSAPGLLLIVLAVLLALRRRSAEVQTRR